MMKSYFNKRTLISLLELMVIIIMIITLLISFWGIISILCSSIFYQWDISLTGLLFFLKGFSILKEILATTLAIIGLFFVIERINLMSESNYSAAREAWKSTLEGYLKTNIGTENPYMRVYFEQISYQLFKYLIKRNFIIYNKLALHIFFFRYVKYQVIAFEKKSKGFETNGGQYQSPDNVYSLEEIQKVISEIFKLSHYYQTLKVDFEKLYRAEVKKFASKNIASK